MVPDCFENDWLTRMFTFCTIGSLTFVDVVHTHFLSNGKDIWMQEEEKIRALRNASMEMCGTRNGELTSIEMFIQSLVSPCSTITMGEIYVLSKHASWNVFIWHNHKCIDVFKFGSDELYEYHFVWNDGVWSLYISISLMSKHQATKPDTFKSLKRKRKEEYVNHINIQKCSFDCGVSQFNQ